MQVESKGEAWYVNPQDNKRYYLGRPNDAILVMRKLGLGITNKNLDKMKNKANYAHGYAGRILLQVESKGEAWYVNPVNLKLYYLGRPQDALTLMRSLGLGISNVDLATIVQADTTNIPVKSAPVEFVNTVSDGRYELSIMEKQIGDMINAERQKAGLALLTWNDELAAVAREHSQDLALEDKSLTNPDLSCDFPLIHHEGLKFGLYHGQRLNNRNIYYFSQSGENIALIPVERRMVSLKSSEKNLELLLNSCPDRQGEMNALLKEKTENKNISGEEKANIVKEEINKRLEAIKKELSVKVSKIEWTSQLETEKTTVKGWMDSPGHRANILKDSYTEAGIGAAYVNGYFIFTQVFVKRAECGFKEGACCEKEGYYPYCYVPYDCKNSICK